MNKTVPLKFGVGAPVRRKEDKAFITGKGCYTSDIKKVDCLHGYMLRSPFAHATFKIEDLDAAQNATGVVAILTASDISELGLLPTVAIPDNYDGEKPFVPDHPILAIDTVRFVGDPVAFVIADSVENARSAAELIEIDYDDQAAVIETGDALNGDAPLVYPERRSNLAFNYRHGDKEKTNAAFAKASQTASIEVINNRLVCNYMETRACIGEYDSQNASYTLTLGSQGVHGIRDVLAKNILNIDPDALTVITPDVGGGFGTKVFVYPEYPLALFAAKKLGRPVKWVQDRSDHFVSCAHGRDNITTAEMAMDENGRFLGLKIKLIAAMGAYLHQFGPFIPWLGTTMSTGVYDIEALDVDMLGVYTHTTPTDAYRGAGRPEAAYLIERLVDECARVTGISREEIRRRNFIKPEQMPYTTQNERVFDSGEFDGHMTQAMTNHDWDGFDKRRAQSEREGKLRGMGLAVYIEACAFAGSEPAYLKLLPTGRFQLRIGTQSNGQGHATAYAQLAAAHFGVSIEEIDVIQGDTREQSQGGGTGGSRSVPIGGVSVDLAGKELASKIKAIAANELEAAEPDLEFIDGRIVIVGTDRSISLADVARAAADEEDVKATGDFKQPEATYPNGTHICEVEVDPLTGVTEIAAYTVVDDFGVTVNPLLLRGQVHGGIVQGIGQALQEQTVYDESGQLLTASFMDYTMPRADTVPSFSFETRNIPCVTNGLGIKGAGEAGSIGSCAAVINALINALESKNPELNHIDMPATPQAVWQLLNT